MEGVVGCISCRCGKREYMLVCDLLVMDGRLVWMMSLGRSLIWCWMEGRNGCG